LKESCGLLIEYAKQEISPRNLSILKIHAENLRTNIADEANLDFPILEFISTGVVDTLKKLLQPPYWENQKLLTEVL